MQTYREIVKALNEAENDSKVVITVLTGKFFA